MNDADVLAEICTALGSQTRAAMMLALADGQAHSASDLALSADVTAQTASNHLATMRHAGLVAVEPRGKQRLYRVANSNVAAMVEELLRMRPARDGRPHERSMMRMARTCYDHLAGLAGVAIAASLVKRGYLSPAGRDFEVSDSGKHFLETWGVDVDSEARKKRLFARQCIDWTERKPHVAGAIGAAIATRAFELEWFERIAGTRALVVSEAGQEGLQRWFGVDWRELLFAPMAQRTGQRAGRLVRHS